MYTKILIVSLMQVALARNLPDGRLIGTQYNSGRQFNFRNSESGIMYMHSSELQHERPDFDGYPWHSDGDYRSERNEHYVKNNYYGVHRRGREPPRNYETQNHESSEATINSYKGQNDDRMGHYSDGSDNRNANDPSQGHRHRNNYRNNNKSRLVNYDPTLNENQDTPKTNLESQSNINNGSSSNRTIEYNSQSTNSSHRHSAEHSVKTNNDSHNSNYSRSLNQSVTLVPVTVRTSSNVHNRVGDTEASNDSLSEVRSYSDSMVFINEDNPKPNGPVKTTDNEVRYNKNEDDKANGDKWIWDASLPTEAATNPTNKTETVLTDGGLDDRTSFNGDACPKGQAKVLGQCIDKY